MSKVTFHLKAITKVLIGISILNILHKLHTHGAYLKLCLYLLDYNGTNNENKLLWWQHFPKLEGIFWKFIDHYTKR